MAKSNVVDAQNRLIDRVSSEQDDVLCTIQLVEGDGGLQGRLFDQLVDLLVEGMFLDLRRAYLSLATSIVIGTWRISPRSRISAARRPAPAPQPRCLNPPSRAQRPRFVWNVGMSDTAPGSWQPDPFGRFAQRYFDGAAWTANVIDGAGQQSTDPPVSWVPSAAATSSASSKRGPQTPALIVGGIGVLFTLLSLFVLNWFDFSESAKDDIKSTSNSTVKRELGLSVSEVVDGLKLTEIKTIADKTEGNTLSGATISI